MALPQCETCWFRSKCDKNPASLLGRLWRFHARFCPGWKRYITSLPDEQRKELARKYHLTKFL
ncbi:hypothetical protein Poly41_25080 [Novipirellula artificiosorum]|uniref:Uncharacterized protein n=1 Tax=Novipirellula artificiosorum TaxID=2528016 RepID=A0A5C6DSN4_9BACT|nr:hypothetical protein Poly41_25080 [Novipirellula artificiosorum]